MTNHEDKRKSHAMLSTSPGVTQVSLLETTIFGVPLRVLLYIARARPGLTFWDEALARVNIGLSVASKPFTHNRHKDCLCHDGNPGRS